MLCRALSYISCTKYSLCKPRGSHGSIVFSSYPERFEGSPIMANSGQAGSPQWFVQPISSTGDAIKPLRVPAKASLVLLELFLKH